MSDNEIMHVGVLGMRWGKRRARQNAILERHGIPQPKNNLSKYKNLNDLRKAGAKKALEKDIADLDKHGMKAEADALRGNLAKMNKAKMNKAKTKVTDILMTPFGSKTKFSDMPPETKKLMLIKTRVALAGIGALSVAAIYKINHPGINVNDVLKVTNNVASVIHL